MEKALFSVVLLLFPLSEFTTSLVVQFCVVAHRDAAAKEPLAAAARQEAQSRQQRRTRRRTGRRRRGAAFAVNVDYDELGIASAAECSFVPSCLLLLDPPLSLRLCGRTKQQLPELTAPRCNMEQGDSQL